MGNIPVIAGMASTLIFAVSTLPMLVKARTTRDLSSYSLGNILLANLGNAVHSVYVFSLPPGPLWVLHSFYLLTSAQMLAWFIVYQVRRKPEPILAWANLPIAGGSRMRRSSDDVEPAGSLASTA